MKQLEVKMIIRKKYTKDFKLDAISLVTEQGYSCCEAARSLGIASRLISRWVRESSDQKEDAFRGNGHLTAEQSEIRRLRAEVKRLTLEKEILKKATVFFAKETK
jgi:transposase